MDGTFSHPILLIEDDENDVVFMRRALKEAGIASGLQVAEDGQQAIDYLDDRDAFADRIRHPLPALVFLDLKLPRVMGMEVLKWIRERPELDMITVIMLTSSQLQSDIQKACSLGANSYLVKPSNPLELHTMMEIVKSYWLTESSHGNDHGTCSSGSRKLRRARRPLGSRAKPGVLATVYSTKKTSPIRSRSLGFVPSRTWRLVRLSSRRP